jgi:formylglycine-generating enzyme required for sulfatase activity
VAKNYDGLEPGKGPAVRFMKLFFSLWLFGFLCGCVSGGSGQTRNKTFTNSIGMEFVLIPAGKFTTYLYDMETFPQVVTISQPFYLGKYEVTQEQWVAVMGKNPSKFKGRTNPVEQVSWPDAQVFIKKLNQKEGGNKYRLPTSAEWEHAARAGSKTKYFFGKAPAALGDYAWFGENSQHNTHSVGEKKPNPWGLYDIYGNVSEWVNDWCEDCFQPGKNSRWLALGEPRVHRGGNWGDTCEYLQSAPPAGTFQKMRLSVLGFRLAFSPE